MNIYFACAITGGREFEAVYQVIVAALESDGHTVPTSHLAAAEVVDLEQVASAQDVYTRDVEWIQQADALIAEVSTPSHGVGYEVAYALSLGKNVLCCYQQGRKVSKMITGNTHAKLRRATYRTPAEAVQVVRDFIELAAERL